MSTNCTDFRAHHLRPDKCKNCFGDKWRHAPPQEEPPPATAAAVATVAATSEQQPPPSSDKMGDASQAPSAASPPAAKCEKCGLSVEEFARLTRELERLEGRCREAESVRDQAREEVALLEREMDEMHDNFKEEESEQFEQVKQELDMALKNCKILQIRLNKCERQYAQLDGVKSMLERQLQEQAAAANRAAPARSHQLAGDESSGGDTAPPASFVQAGADWIKLPTSEYDQLLRDLNDTIEREKDLQEQIKYSQEEAQMKGDRLQAIEAENEVLLSRVNQLTLANSRLRSSSLTARRSVSDGSGGGGSEVTATSPDGDKKRDADSNNAASGGADLIQQSEQLKLALDLAQSECERLRSKWQETLGHLESRESSLKECETRRSKLEDELRAAQRSAGRREAGGTPTARETKAGAEAESEHLARVELECRQLRSRLIHSERDCKQLRAQLEELVNLGGGASRGDGRQSRTGERVSLGAIKSLSMESAGEQAARQASRQLKAQCESLRELNASLEKKLELASANSNGPSGGDQTRMESDLLAKLKRQLDVSESELAKARSRSVELDVECGRLQRQYKRLVESIENSAGEVHQSALKVRLPPESMRDSMSRQELRQAVRELEEEISELSASLRAKDCLMRERAAGGGGNGSGTAPTTNDEADRQQLKRLLEQERSLSKDLKTNIGNLERDRVELQRNLQMLERERVVIGEELDKLRQVNQELNGSLEEAKAGELALSNKLKELQLELERARSSSSADRKAAAAAAMVNHAATHQQQQQQKEQKQHQHQRGGESGGNSAATAAELMLAARDLSELKVKNEFLIRQLELAREDTARQLEDQCQASEAQLRRSVELAQLELKERQLVESQQLRDELNELKQRLAGAQRQATRANEEAASERDRLRSLERDVRRDKSQWQQRLEQLEAQQAIERRSSEFKVKEAEAATRDKERELIGVQDKYVQLERDFKRLQNKYSLLEENSESRQKGLLRELEARKRELGEVIATSQRREDEFYDQCKRFKQEKATLVEALESIRRSYDEKLVELKSTRELLLLRQDQSYKERAGAQERLDQLGAQLIRMSEHETQAKLAQQQLQMAERQLDSLRREHLQLKEDRTRLKTRCDELERRCTDYEKRELISKTTSISTAGGLFQKATKSPALFQSTTTTKTGQVNAGGVPQPVAVKQQQQDNTEQKPNGGGGGNNNSRTREQTDNSQMIERLSEKINDQRHLINMLKQQHAEAQMELKQVKLVQASEKNRWQVKVAQLSGRLNECEERLLFESSLVVGRETFENARRKLETNWAQERQASLDMIQQQQTQNELLMRDLKKLGQAHDLLRLQAKQLETHNNKLSKKLIEYQQQSIALPTNTKQQKQTAAGLTSNSDSDRRLDSCLAAKQELERRQTELTKRHSRLVKIMREEAQPLIETVTKMVAALDSSSSATTKSTADSKTTTTTNSSRLGSPDRTAAAEARSNSRNRPLVTRPPPDSDNDTDSIGPDLIASAAAQPQQQQSRLSRLLGKQPKSGADQKVAGSSAIAAGSGGGTKSVKRTRIKSSSLGITIAEKKQLKKHLHELTCVLDEVQRAPLASPTTTATADRSRSTSAEQQVATPTNHQLRPSSGQQQSALYTPASRGPSHSGRSSESPSQSGRVHGQASVDDGGDDVSDLESDKSHSFAAARLVGPEAQRAGTTTPTTNPSIYRRFPQSTPGGGGVRHSLTDYESDVSLASDYSSYWSNQVVVGPGSGRFVSGTESDSCVQSPSLVGLKAGVGSGGARKRPGLKGRLTSTLRNISRSITGMASDSETESPSKPKVSGSGGRRKRETTGAAEPAPVAAESAMDERRALREIRV